MGGMLGKFFSGAAQTGADILKSDREASNRMEHDTTLFNMNAQLQKDLAARQQEFAASEGNANRQNVIDVNNLNRVSAEGEGAANRESARDTNEYNRVSAEGEGAANRAMHRDVARMHAKSLKEDKFAPTIIGDDGFVYARVPGSNSLEMMKGPDGQPFKAPKPARDITAMAKVVEAIDNEMQSHKPDSAEYKGLRAKKMRVISAMAGEDQIARSITDVADDKTKAPAAAATAPRRRTATPEETKSLYEKFRDPNKTIDYRDMTGGAKDPAAGYGQILQFLDDNGQQ